MKIAFVYRGFENIGLESLSAILKQEGYETRLFFEPQLFDDYILKIRPLHKIFNYNKDIIRGIIDYQPDLIGFSVPIHQYEWSLKIARRLKEQIEAPIVFGGPHPTTCPEEVIGHNYIDFLIRGFGEYALLELVRCLESGKMDCTIRNLWSKKNGEVIRNSIRPVEEGFHDLPFLDKGLFYDVNEYEKLGYITESGRGCPYRCTFCYSNYLHRLYGSKNAYIKRMPESVIEELEQAKQKWDIRFVRFIEYTFTYDREWLNKFCEAYKSRIQVPYWCLVYPENIDAEAIRLLKDSGCVEVEMGVQSINPAIRKEILHRPGSNEKIREAIHLFKEAEIRVAADTIINPPGITGEILEDTVQFYMDNMPDRINLFWLMFFPEVDITKQALQKGLLTENRYREIVEGRNLTLILFGGNLFEKSIARFYTLLILMHFIPKPVIRFLLNKRRYRLLPFLGFIPSTFLLYGLVKMDLSEANILIQKRTQLRYRVYIKKRIKNIVSSFLDLVKKDKVRHKKHSKR